LGAKIVKNNNKMKETDKAKIKRLEAKVKACDNLFRNFIECINTVGGSNTKFKKSLLELIVSIDEYKTL
jgi:hypothetical protein